MLFYFCILLFIICTSKYVRLTTKHHHDTKPIYGTWNSAVDDENNNLNYVRNMMDLLSVVDKGLPSQRRNFPGLKQNALVFWRNYPEYINLDNHIKTFSNIHLLDVKDMVRAQSKICSVDGIRFNKNGPYCDKVHFCLGTVQHSWNMKLAIQVLEIRNGIQFNVEKRKTFNRFFNAYKTDASHCTANTCNGFEEDVRYRCKITDESKYEVFPNQTIDTFADAFKNLKLCFFGDSLSAGQSQTLENEMRSRDKHSSATHMKLIYGNASFNPSTKRAYYLNKIERNGYGLYKRGFTLYEGIFDDMFDNINTCDIVVLNSALFWRNPVRAQSVGHVQKFNPS